MSPTYFWKGWTDTKNLNSHWFYNHNFSDIELFNSWVVFLTFFTNTIFTILQSSNIKVGCGSKRYKGLLELTNHERQVMINNAGENLVGKNYAAQSLIFYLFETRRPVLESTQLSLAILSCNCLKFSQVLE